MVVILKYMKYLFLAKCVGLRESLFGKKKKCWTEVLHERRIKSKGKCNGGV